jgi:hypothetical protein
MSNVPPIPSEQESMEIRQKLRAGNMPHIDKALRESKLQGIRALRNETGLTIERAKRYCDERYEQLKLMGQLEDRGFETPQDEIRFWRELCIHLADCTAATAYHEGTMKSCSKSRRKRHASICKTVADAIEHLYFDRHRNHGRTADDVALRCREAAAELEEA